MGGEKDNGGAVEGRWKNVEDEKDDEDDDDDDDDDEEEEEEEEVVVVVVEEEEEKEFDGWGQYLTEPRWFNVQEESPTLMPRFFKVSIFYPVNSFVRFVFF